MGVRFTSVCERPGSATEVYVVEAPSEQAARRANGSSAVIEVAGTGGAKGTAWLVVFVGSGPPAFLTQQETASGWEIVALIGYDRAEDIRSDDFPPGVREVVRLLA